jgi:alpha-N-arabinofuranosidase
VVEGLSTGRTAIFTLNRHPTETLDLDAELRGTGKNRTLVTALELRHENLKATNTRDHPDEVTPVANANLTIDGEHVKARLKPLSWNVMTAASS